MSDVQGAPQSHEKVMNLILMAADATEDDIPVLAKSWLLARTFGSKLLVCYVVQMRTTTAGNESDGHPANDQERKLLDHLNKTVIDMLGASVKGVEVKILHGDPAERIVEYAEHSGADLIVVGSSGRSGIKKVILGSVSSVIASRSKRSVLIVRDQIN